MKRVLVLGGGVAGLSAAHELAERKFEVTILESSDDIGGRARSKKISGLPTEHGFHFFPAFYRHLIDTMRRIPSAGGAFPRQSVVDDLVASSRVIMARDGLTELDFNLDLGSLPDIAGLANSFAALGLRPSEVALAVQKLIELIVAVSTHSDDALENVTWWDFVEADSQSPEYQRYFGDVAVRWTVAMDPRRASARTLGRVALQFWRTTVAPVKTNGHTVASVGRVLDGPTSDAWLKPWREHLAGPRDGVRGGAGTLGVTLLLNTKVVAINCKNGKVHEVVVTDTVPAGAGTRTLAFHGGGAQYDYCVCALPIGALVDLINPEKHVAPVLAALEDPVALARREKSVKEAVDRLHKTIHESKLSAEFEAGKGALINHLEALRVWRQEERRSVAADVTFTQDRRALLVRAEDVSTGGLRFRTMDRPALGSNGSVAHESFAAKATVRWVDGAYAGAEFTPHVPREKIDAFIKTVARRRPEPGAAGTKRKDQHAIEDILRHLVATRTSLEIAVPSLRPLRDLRQSMGWMVGLQFFLRRDVPVARGGIMLRDSPWAITAVSQVQFWKEKQFVVDKKAPVSPSIRAVPGNAKVAPDTEIKGVLSVIISNWEARGHFQDMTAKECDEEQLFYEVWSELKAHLNNQPNGPGEGREPVLDDKDLLGWFCSIERVEERPGHFVWQNPDPLFINTVGSLAKRPGATTNASNFFLAGDYAKTSTDFASMEAANESARLAVNGLLDETNSSAPRCETWPLDLQLSAMGLAALSRGVKAIRAVGNTVLSETSNLWQKLPFRPFRGP